MRFLRLGGLTVIVLSVLIGASQFRLYPTEDVLTIWVRGSPEQTAIYRQIIDEFRTLNPEAKLRVEVMPARRFVQKLLAGIDAGHAPDVFNLHWRDMPQVSSTGQLLPLDELVARHGIDRDDYYPVGLRAYTYRGVLYGLPVKGSTISCYYNMDLFDRYGVDYPPDDWTWEELVEKARKLTVDEDGDGMTDIYGLTPYDIANYVWSAGGDFLRQQDGRWVSNLDDPKVLLGTQFYVDLYFKDKVSPPRPGMRSDNPMSTFTFEAGRVAMAITGPWRIPDYQLLDRFRWNLALVPEGPGGRQTRYAGSGFSIWKNTPQPEAAWKLVEFLVGPESMAKMAVLGSDLPPQRSVARTAFLREDTPWDEEVFVRAMDYEVQIFPQEVWWEDLFRRMQDELDAALAGRETVAESLRQAHEVTNAYLDRIYRDAP